MKNQNRSRYKKLVQYCNDVSVYRNWEGKSLFQLAFKKTSPSLLCTEGFPNKLKSLLWGWKGLILYVMKLTSTIIRIA